ncbi:MAG: hypothetical protein M1420_05495 [Actinobacteria bacterium]|nr:hypothetical protein [Actinomycetota bacterium]
MATVGELSALYQNHLLPVLPNGKGICRMCHAYTIANHHYCYQCNQARANLPACASAVSFVALAVKGEQLARDLWVYKNRWSPAARTRPQLGLAALLWRWLAHHEECLATAAGVNKFPVVTTVPSTTGREEHPLDAIVGTVIGATAERFRPLLHPGARNDDDREFSAKRFDVDTPAQAVNTTPVLLIDDTFTSGAHAQSAAARLIDASYGPVAILCIGRHFNRNPKGKEFRDDAERYYRDALRLGWDWSRCCLCSQ